MQEYKDGEYIQVNKMKSNRDKIETWTCNHMYLHSAPNHASTQGGMWHYVGACMHSDSTYM